jgi:hypothetical protein
MEDERSHYFERVSVLDTAIYEDLQARNNARKRNTLQFANPQDSAVNDTSRALEMLAQKWIDLAMQKKREYDKYTKYTRKLFRYIAQICQNDLSERNMTEVVARFKEKFEES